MIQLNSIQIPLRTLSLFLLSQTSLHDFNLYTLGGAIVSCSSKLLELRQVGFISQAQNNGGNSKVSDKSLQISDKEDVYIANGIVISDSPPSIITPPIIPPVESSSSSLKVKYYKIPLTLAATSMFVHWVYTLSLPTYSLSTEPILDTFLALLIFSKMENLPVLQNLIVGRLLDILEVGKSREQVESIVEMAALCREDVLWIRALAVLQDNKFITVELEKSDDPTVETLIPAVLIPSLQSYSAHSFSRPSPPPSPLKTQSFTPNSSAFPLPPTSANPVASFINKSFTNALPNSTGSNTDRLLPSHFSPQLNPTSKLAEYKSTTPGIYSRRGSLQDIFVESPPSTPNSILSSYSTSSTSSSRSEGQSQFVTSLPVTSIRSPIRGSMERFTRSWREEEEIRRRIESDSGQEVGTISRNQKGQDIPKIVVVDYRHSLLPPLPASGSYAELDDTTSLTSGDEGGVSVSPSRSRASFSVNLRGIKKKLSLAVGGSRGTNGVLLRSDSVAEVPPSPSPRTESTFLSQQTIRSLNGLQSSTMRSSSPTFSTLSDSSTPSSPSASRGKMPFGLNY